ncbi:LysM peptidoglycan-binding domain-containing protein [Fredinandcohnia humi]
MSNLQFWLSYNNGAERLRLPVNPPSISVTASHGYEDIDVTKLGEYTVIGDEKLKEFSFSSFFPRDYNAGYCEYADIPKPWEAVKTIERWLKTRRPIRLTITGTPINYAVTIRDFSYEEKGGNPGDIYFTVSLKEYKFIHFRKIEVKKQATTKTKAVAKKASNSRPNTKVQPKSHSVARGDSLWKIAQRHLGNGSRWREIYNLNKGTIGANPNLIKPGQKLVLPS